MYTAQLGQSIQVCAELHSCQDYPAVPEQALLTNIHCNCDPPAYSDPQYRGSAFDFAPYESGGCLEAKRRS